MLHVAVLELATLHAHSLYYEYRKCKYKLAMCFRYNIRKFNVQSGSREYQTFRTQRAVKNITSFRRDVVHAYSHPLQSKNAMFKV